MAFGAEWLLKLAMPHEPAFEAGDSVAGWCPCTIIGRTVAVGIA